MLFLYRDIVRPSGGSIYQREHRFGQPPRGHGKPSHQIPNNNGQRWTRSLSHQGNHGGPTPVSQTIGSKPVSTFPRQDPQADSVVAGGSGSKSTQPNVVCYGCGKPGHRDPMSREDMAGGIPSRPLSLF